MIHMQHDASVRLFMIAWKQRAIIFLLWKADHCFPISDYQLLGLVIKGLQQHMGMEGEKLCFLYFDT